MTPGEESLYKREEDRKWRESVESRLVSLTSAQNTTDGELDKKETRLDELEILLEGDPLEKNDTGLKGDLADAWKVINKLDAIIAPDNLGGGGVKNRLEAVERGLGLRQKSKLSRRAFVVAVGLALVSTTGFIISNWDKVEQMARWIQKKPAIATASRNPTRRARKGKSVPKMVPTPTAGLEGPAAAETPNFDYNKPQPTPTNPY